MSTTEAAIRPSRTAAPELEPHLDTSAVRNNRIDTTEKAAVLGTDLSLTFNHSVLHFTEINKTFLRVITR